MAGRWFSPDTPVSSTNKTDCHDIAEILLQLALNTIKKIGLQFIFLFIFSEMASIHSDDVDGGSIDTAASRKGVDQHKHELLALEQQLAEKHNKEIQNLQTQHQARIKDIEEKYKVRVTSLRTTAG